MALGSRQVSYIVLHNCITCGPAEKKVAGDP